MDSEPTIDELFSLRGKSALVTGAVGYLGQAIAKGLAEAGASVVVASSSRESQAQSFAEQLPTPWGAQHHAVTLNHLDETSCQRGFEAAVEKTGGLDILVNNGLAAVQGDVHTATHEQFAQHQGNNAGYFILARHLRDHVVASDRPGNVIMVGSMYGSVGSYPDTYEGICAPSSVAYHTLKGGTLQMTRHLAVYWAQDNVRVNCLSPGPFPNPASAPAELVKRLDPKSPMKRMGLPHELKGAVVFLASAASSYVTGHNLVVDGGWTAW